MAKPAGGHGNPAHAGVLLGADLASLGTASAGTASAGTASAGTANPSPNAVVGTPSPDPSAASILGLTLYRRRAFAWKVALLAVSTVALVPILLYKDVIWAGLYTAFLIVVHVVGIVIIAIGTRRHHLAPDRRGLAIRLVGIAVLTVLLYLATKGITSQVTEWVFWGSLFAIWALHTLGLALLHVRGSRESKVCPFA